MWCRSHYVCSRVAVAGSCGSFIPTLSWRSPFCALSSVTNCLPLSNGCIVLFLLTLDALWHFGWIKDRDREPPFCPGEEVAVLRGARVTALRASAVGELCVFHIHTQLVYRAGPRERSAVQTAGPCGLLVRDPEVRQLKPERRDPS